VAAQAAREAAEKAARAAAGPTVPARKKRTTWGGGSPMRGPGRGPQKPPASEE
jgi:hypothetical protein